MSRSEDASQPIADYAVYADYERRSGRKPRSKTPCYKNLCNLRNLWIVRTALKHPTPRVLLKFLKPYDGSIRELTLSLRQVVLDELNPCCEYIYDAYSAVALGYGPTDRMQDGICHIAVYSKHVNLGFNQGTTLDDPKGLLQGTGKWIRHMTFRENSDVVRPEVSEYLRKARKQSQLDKSQPPGPKRLVSTVKGISPKKRRPSKVQVR